jgi:SAM-dependent methyltransferase
MRSGGTLRVLDIGAGPGTTALALLDLANMAERYGLEPTLGIELTCVDRDGAKLRFAKANVHEFSRRLAPRTRQLASGCVKGERWRVADMVDVLSGLDTRFDLVILGNVLRESQVLCHSLREGILTQRLGGGRPLSRLAGDGVLFATEQGQLGVAGLESANTLCSLRTKMIKLGLSPLEPQSSRCHDCRGVTGVDDCQCTHPYRIKWPEYYVEWTGGKPRDSKIRSMWVAMQASAENEAS